MDAAALLRSQGWRGAGHSLHASSDSIGLKHHILISRNDDGRGLGHKNKSQQATAWWMNAFDQALKGNAGALETVTRGKVGKYTGNGGLYGSFVKGGLLKGTMQDSGLLTPPDSGIDTPTDQVTDGAKKETKEERRARRTARRLRKAEKSLARKTPAMSDTKASLNEGGNAETKRYLKKREGETREERRVRREARRKRKEEKRRRKVVTAG